MSFIENKIETIENASYDELDNLDNLDDIANYSNINEIEGNSIDKEENEDDIEKYNLPLAFSNNNPIRNESISNDFQISLMREFEDKWNEIEKFKQKMPKREIDFQESQINKDNSRNSFLLNWKNYLQESKRKFIVTKEAKCKEDDDFGEFVKKKTMQLKQLIKENKNSAQREIAISDKRYNTEEDKKICKREIKSFLKKDDELTEKKIKIKNMPFQNKQIKSKIIMENKPINQNGMPNFIRKNESNSNALYNKIKNVYKIITEGEEEESYNKNNNAIGIGSLANSKNYKSKHFSLGDLSNKFEWLMSEMSPNRKNKNFINTYRTKEKIKKKKMTSSSYNFNNNRNRNEPMKMKNIFAHITSQRNYARINSYSPSKKFSLNIIKMPISKSGLYPINKTLPPGFNLYYLNSSLISKIINQK